MDISALMTTMLSNDSLQGLSQKTGASTDDIKKVLSSALPDLLNGAKTQAEDTNSGFNDALSSHAKNNTGNLPAFFKNVDLSDGAKIVGHLLGSGKNDAAQISRATGVKQDTVSQILSLIAPLLMSLLGQQTASAQSNNTASLMGSLLGNVNISTLAASLLGGTNTNTNNHKPSKPAQKTDGIASIITNLLK